MLVLQKKKNQKQEEIWPSFFTKIRRWLPSDCAADRLAWISIANLPISGWNMACLTNLLQDMGRLIGYDKISQTFSSLYAIRLLIGTQNSDTLHSEVTLRLNGDDYRITISETDSLPYPDSDSIPYSIDTLFGNTAAD